MRELYKPQPDNRDLFVYDTELNLVGMVSEYTSLVLERSHFGVGNFTLTLPVHATGIETLKYGHIVCLGQSDARAGIMEHMELDRERAPKLMTVSGCMLKGLVRRRIIVPPTLTEDPNALGWDRVSGTAEEVYRHYMNRHVVNPTDPNRTIPLVVLDELHDPPRGMTTPWQAKHDEQLVNVLQQIGEWTDMGYDIRLDVKNKQLVFVVVPGRDKTLGNTNSETPVLFSEQMDNLIASRYQENRSEYTNSPYFGGAGEDENQLVLNASFDEDGNQLETPLSGWERRESWIAVGNTGDPDTLYADGARKYMDARKFIRGLESTITATGSFIYGRDWDLGDRVSVYIEMFGAKIRLDSRITLVREVYERGGTTVEVTVGSSELTLRDRIIELQKRM